MRFDPPLRIGSHVIHSVIGLIEYAKYFQERHAALLKNIRSKINDEAKKVFSSYATDLEKRAAELELEKSDAQYWKNQYLRLKARNRRKYLEQQHADPIIQSVTNKIKQRSDVGIKKYGTTLADNTTDNFLVHLQQELMDAVNYTEKLLQDRNKLSKDLCYLLWEELQEKLTPVEITLLQNKVINALINDKQD